MADDGSLSQHVLYPRVKGFSAVLDGLGDMLTALYDVTIAYEGKVRFERVPASRRVADVHAASALSR